MLTAPRIATLLVTLSVAASCAPAEDVLADMPPSPDRVESNTEPVPGWPVAGAPNAPTAPAIAPSGTIPTAPAAGVPRYALPEGWSEEPPATSMRLAQIAGPGGVECALFSFPGGGSVEANIARWIDQFEQPDGTASREHARTMSMNIDGSPATFVRVAGTFMSQNPPMSGPIVPMLDYGLFGVVFEVQPDPFFLKCVGPRTAIEAQAESLTQLVGSFRFAG